MIEEFFSASAITGGAARNRTRRRILQQLRLGGTMSRAELARAIGLTPPAIAGVVQDLLALGLVREAGRRKSSRGQPPIEIELASDGGFAIGLRVDSDGYDFVVSNLAGELIDSGVGKTPDDPDHVVDFLATVYRRLADQYGAERSLGLGLVTPGPFDAIWPGTPTPGQLPALQTRALVQRLSNLLDVDVFLENDATAAALGERLSGVATDAENIFYVYVGEGVGSGVLLRNEPYRGANGNAGEFGHMVVNPDGPKCYCGNKGCLGQYLSLSSQRVWLRDAKNGGFEAWLASATQALSTALVNIENLLDPDVIVLGGTAPRDLLEALITRLQPMRPSLRMGLPGKRLVLSALGPQSASYGAAALPIIAATSPL